MERNLSRDIILFIIFLKYYIIFLFGSPFNPKCADKPDLIPATLWDNIPNPSNVIDIIDNDAIYWMNVLLDCSTISSSSGYNH